MVKNTNNKMLSQLSDNQRFKLTSYVVHAKLLRLPSSYIDQLAKSKHATSYPVSLASLPIVTFQHKRYLVYTIRNSVTRGGASVIIRALGVQAGCSWVETYGLMQVERWVADFPLPHPFDLYLINRGNRVRLFCLDPRIFIGQVEFSWFC